MCKLQRILLIACLTVASMTVPAHALQMGETLAPLQLKDQHDQAHSLGSDIRLVLLASSHNAARLVDSALKDTPAEYLNQRKAVYVADISKVPGLVAKMVLVPSMRSASYRVLLDREGHMAPERTGAEPVLWISLEDRKVLDAREFNDSEALRAALEQASP